MFFPKIPFFKGCKVVECNLFVSGDNGAILHIIANVYTSNFKPSYCMEGGACHGNFGPRKFWSGGPKFPENLVRRTIIFENIGPRVE